MHESTEQLSHRSEQNLGRQLDFAVSIVLSAAMLGAHLSNKRFMVPPFTGLFRDWIFMLRTHRASHACPCGLTASLRREGCIF